MSSVTIRSAVPDDGNFAITLVRTGDQTAVLEVQHWTGDASGQPDTDNSYDLQGLTFDGVNAECTTDALFGMPHISVSLGTSPPAAVITVSHTMFWDKSWTLPLTPADLEALKGFLTGFSS